MEWVFQAVHTSDMVSQKRSNERRMREEGIFVCQKTVPQRSLGNPYFPPDAIDSQVDARPQAPPHTLY